MPTIKSTFLLILSFSLVSCTGKKSSPSVHHEKSGLSYMGMGERSIQLKLHQDNNLFSNHTEVTAEIDVPAQYTGDIHFKWKIGSDITLVSGETSGIVKANAQNTHFIFKLKVENFKNYKQRFIRFEAVGMTKKNSIYTDGIISSTLDSSFEDTVQKVEKFNAEK
jgi:hypothetical protein